MYSVNIEKNSGMSSDEIGHDLDYLGDTENQNLESSNETPIIQILEDLQETNAIFHKTISLILI